MGSSSVSNPVSTSVGVEPGEGRQPEDGKGTIRVIVADTQAIFRAGLRKIFALEDDIRVVGQAESLEQTVTAIQRFSADIVILEAALAPNPADAIADLLRQNASLPFGCRAAGTRSGNDARPVPTRRAWHRFARS